MMILFTLCTAFNPIELLIIIFGYIFTWLFTSYLINKIIIRKKSGKIDLNKDGRINKTDEKILHEGRIIGKCENIIVLTLVLIGDYTSLAIVFTAKSLVRQEEIKGNSEYFLAGTLLNFTASLVIGVAISRILDYI